MGKGVAADPGGVVCLSGGVVLQPGRHVRRGEGTGTQAQERNTASMTTALTHKTTFHSAPLSDNVYTHGNSAHHPTNTMCRVGAGYVAARTRDGMVVCRNWPWAARRSAPFL